MKMTHRNFLLSSGCALMLPQLAAIAKTTAVVPQRLVFLGFSYGFTKDFYPTTFGRAFSFRQV